MTDEMRQLVEDFGATFDRVGVDKMSGRLLAWLVLCQPARQSLGQLAAELGASRSAISTSTRLLTAWGVLDRISVPGSREAWYQLRRDPWLHMFELDREYARIMQRFATRGAALVGADGGDTARLREMGVVFDFLEQEQAALLDRLRARLAREE